VNALVSKGLADAALVVLDDYLRDPDSQGWANFARYRKATILLDQGDRQRARRELAKLYADDPNYDDSEGLRAKLGARVGRSGRAAIPEEVRHAVWRRDKERCVQCGMRNSRVGVGRFNARSMAAIAPSSSGSLMRPATSSRRLNAAPMVML
jgi:hypothetical protein